MEEFIREGEEIIGHDLIISLRVILKNCARIFEGKDGTVVLRQRWGAHQTWCWTEHRRCVRSWRRCSELLRWTWSSWLRALLPVRVLLTLWFYSSHGFFWRYPKTGLQLSISWLRFGLTQIQTILQRFLCWRNTRWSKSTLRRFRHRIISCRSFRSEIQFAHALRIISDFGSLIPRSGFIWSDGVDHTKGLGSRIVTLVHINLICRSSNRLFSLGCRFVYCAWFLRNDVVVSGTAETGGLSTVCFLR